jgi:hypothetical protein
MSKLVFDCPNMIEQKIKEFAEKNSDYFTKGEQEDENKSAAIRALLIRGLRSEGLWE